MNLAKIWTFGLTAVVSTLGGYLFSLAHIPLAWMIGAMVASAMLSWVRPAALPLRTRPVALMVLGASFGLGFTQPVLMAVLAALPAVILAGVLIIVSGLLMARVFATFAGIDSKTGYFCAVPGGVTVMPVLAERSGLPVAPVTLAQTIRMVVVVLTFPPLMVLFGQPGNQTIFHAEKLAVHVPQLLMLLAASLAAALALHRLRIANPWMLGPLFFSMAITAFWHAPSGVPHWMINVAQVGMGSTLGVKLTRPFLMSSTRLVYASLASTLLLSALLSTLAIALAFLWALPPEAVILGMAPGGTPEMVVTAATLDVAVPLVLGFHLIRMLISNLLIEPLWTISERLRVN